MIEVNDLFVGKCSRKAGKSCRVVFRTELQRLFILHARSENIGDQLVGRT
jgi:hypothetical protein